jgi:ABC-type nitrate/sulfonate/bicarbonate transport system substrate-binding protein
VAGRGMVLPGGEHVISIVMAYRSDLLTNPAKKAAAKGIASVLLRGKKWTLEHPEEAQRITAQVVGLAMDVVKAAWGKLHWDARLTEDKIEDIQQKATLLGEAGISRGSKKVDVRKDLIDPSVVSTK